MSYKIAVLAALMLALSACAKDTASDTYTTSSTGGKVLKGTIISARAVKIKEHDKLQDNTVGGLAGGAAGAVGGASIGHGNGSIASGIGGAVIGAVAGAFIQDALSTTDGMEYLVKLDAKNMRTSSPNHKKKVTEKTNGGVEADLNSSTDVDTQTDMISVVQKADPALSEGSLVYVVYSDDRPRLVPVKVAAK